MYRNQNLPGLLVHIAENIGLVFRLMLDSRVPTRWKLFVGAIIAYVVSPLDLVPDIFPFFGQIDDLTLLLLGLKIFLDATPKYVTGQPGDNRSQNNSGEQRKSSEFVDASYRVVEDDSRD